VVDVAHDGDDRRPRLHVFGLVLDIEDAFLDISLGDALDRVAEFLGDDSAMSASIRSPGFIIWPSFIRYLTTSTDAFGHALGKFLNGDGLGQLHLARNLLARLVARHRAFEFLLATAHRRQRARAALAVGADIGKRELATAALVGRDAATGAEQHPAFLPPAHGAPRLSSSSPAARRPDVLAAAFSSSGDLFGRAWRPRPRRVRARPSRRQGAPLPRAGGARIRRAPSRGARLPRRGAWRPRRRACGPRPRATLASSRARLRASISPSES
jgi:hypothetical protein